MRSLLDLRIQVDSFPQPITGHDRFLRIATEEGLLVETIHVRGHPFDPEEVYEKIHTAQGFWITTPYLLEDERVRSMVESRLRDGAVAIAEMRTPDQAGENHLQHYGLEASSIRAVANVPDKEYPHEMLVCVDMESHPFAFRDATLFKDVNRLLLQQANGVGCFGDARPILGVPSSTIQLLETRTDFFVSGIPRPELPVMATSSRRDWRGRIIALSGRVLHDPYSGVLGSRFPGISAADNEVFARNLLRAVSSGTPHVGPSWPEVFSLIDAIETRVARLTEQMLSRTAGVHWFEECVPEGVRAKCMERFATERSGFPVAAYLDLVDYKAIWRGRWGIFEPLLQSVAPPATKTRSLAFLQQVNEMRKSAMHASKRYYARLSIPAASDIDALRGHLAFVTALIAASSRSNFGWPDDQQP